MKTERRHPLDWSPWVLAPLSLALLFPLLLGWPARAEPVLSLPEQAAMDHLRLGIGERLIWGRDPGVAGADAEPHRL